MTCTGLVVTVVSLGLQAPESGLATSVTSKWGTGAIRGPGGAQNQEVLLPAAPRAKSFPPKERVGPALPAARRYPRVLLSLAAATAQVLKERAVALSSVSIGTLLCP